MPRVVPEQRSKLENEEFFRRLSRECEIKSTRFRERPLEERQPRFQNACWDGRSEILMSPLAQGLFHPAISQSGTSIMNTFITREPLKAAVEIAHLAGRKHNSTRIMVECLRTLSGAQAFFHVNVQRDPKDMIWFLSSVVDGVVFPEDPVALLSRGEATPVPYLLSINSLEMEWNLPFAGKTSGLTTPESFSCEQLMKFHLTLHLMKKKTPGEISLELQHPAVGSKGNAWTSCQPMKEKSQN